MTGNWRGLPIPTEKDTYFILAGRSFENEMGNRIDVSVEAGEGFLRRVTVRGPKSTFECELTAKEMAELRLAISESVIALRKLHGKTGADAGSAA